MHIFSLIIIALVAFLPILLWGYIFSYMDNSPLNARRFAIGILAGSLSVVPVLFMGEVFASLSLTSWNIFPLLIHGDNFITLSLSALLTILGITGVIGIFSFGFFFAHIGKTVGIYVKNTLVLLVFVLFFALFHTVVFPLGFWNNPLSAGWVTINGIVFGTLKLVLFYYLVIGIIEEASKHFSVLGSSFPSIDTVKKWILFSVFIALGFGFIENILYLKNISVNEGLWSSGVFTTWIFRSIFSLLVHVICSIIVGLHFSRGWLLLQSWGRFVPYMKTLLYGFLLSIVVHAVFDISLTIGFTGIIFIYFFFGYLGITKVFYNS